MCRKWIRTHSGFHMLESQDIEKRTQKGSITAEATVFLTIFIMFYLFFIYLVQMSRAQMILQYSLNEAAKEISAYSYVLTKTGTIEKRLQTAESANKFKEKSQEVIDCFKKLGTVLTSESDDLFQKAEDIKEAGKEAYEKPKAYAKDYLSDPKNLLNALLEVAKNAGADWVSEKVMGEIVKDEVKKQIEVMSHKEADRYLKDLGITDGLEGLDFSRSKWAVEKKGGMPVLEVTVTYTMNLDLGWFTLEPRKFKLTAKTALW